MDYDPAALYGYDDSGFYEDGETGEMFQAPPTATRKNRSVSVREQGDDISRRLLLNYICRYPAIFATISRFVKPEGFGDGLTGQAARVIYGQMQRKGSVDEASVLSSFPEAQDQTQIAGIFHTLDQASSGKDREKAIRETLIKVFSAAPSGDGTDLNQVIARKKQEAELRKLQIIL
jgi:DNA primase